MITTETLLDGQKNCAVKVTGHAVDVMPWRLVVDLDRFQKPRPRLVKIDHIEWMVTDKIEVFIGWQVGEGMIVDLIMPLGGRGSLNFSDYGGLSNQGEKKSGNIIARVQQIEEFHPNEVNAFSLFIDLIKQE